MENATETIVFGEHRLPRAQYDRISRAHEDLSKAVSRAGRGPRDAALDASEQIWRKHGARTWSAADLRAEQAAVRAAKEAHPDYQEWIRLSAEMDRRIARNRELGRPLLAFSDADWAE